MHPRACVSAISTFSFSLPEDLAFWQQHHIDTVGVSVAKLERFGWDTGTQLVADAVGRGLRVANLIGLGPFNLARPESWPKQQDRLAHSLDTAAAVGAECLVFTTGPFAPLTWEEAADNLEAAITPALAAGEGTRHPVRDRAHQLAARRRGIRALPEGRDRPRAPARRRGVHGDERVLGRARARNRRSAPASIASSWCR